VRRNVDESDLSNTREDPAEKPVVLGLQSSKATSIVDL